jgi:pilus assembly protein CpaB
MQRHRVLIAFGIAWLSALLLSWWVYKKTAAPESREVAQVVAAAQELPVGKRIEAGDLKLVTLDRKDLPKGAYMKMADVVDRAVATAIAASELVLDGKLAAKGSGEGLTALIDPGMRAVSVPVNEISGVSGFIQPGTRVDVLFTRIFSNGDAATTTILQNVKVIAYGKQLDSGAKVDPRDAAKPTVATLLVSQEEAEKLALAVQRGRIQLALRNALDDEVTEEAEPVRSADLGIEEPQKSKPAPPVDPLSIATKKGAKPENDGHVVIRVYRGDKVTEETFE